MPSRFHPLFWLLLLFAVIGLFRQLQTNPVDLLVFVGLTALVLFLVKNYFKTGRFLPRFRSVTPPVKRTNKTQRVAKKQGGRKQTPFKVIEGSKGKSREQAKDKEPNMYR